MNREERVQIFERTMNLSRENEKLDQAVRKSIASQGVIWEEDILDEPVVPEDHTPQILISQKRTLEAAAPYSRDGKKVCALNFASYVAPGGGVAKGASSQEESICRISTLYPAISDSSVREFYRKHLELIREKKEQGKSEGMRKNRDDCIYTPSVVVLRMDTKQCELIPQKDWYEADILTATAPDLRKIWVPEDEEELADIFDRRVRRILQIAALMDVQVLILGAFGCGVFANPPYIVAKAFEKAIDELGPCFETIEFAMGHDSEFGENYMAFSEIRNIQKI